MMIIKKMAKYSERWQKVMTDNVIEWTNHSSHLFCQCYHMLYFCLILWIVFVTHAVVETVSAFFKFFVASCLITVAEVDV